MSKYIIDVLASGERLPIALSKPDRGLNAASSQSNENNVMAGGIGRLRVLFGGACGFSRLSVPGMSQA